MRPTRPFESVYFDCDSTLTRIEGVDELAASMPSGRRDELRGLTDLAMNGAVPLADIYGRRLDVLRPSREALAAIGTRYVETLVDGAAAVVAVLHALGKSVGIVSGGLRPAVVVVGKRLGIDPSDVHAVDVAFEADGSYRDFDRASPFARNGGKPEFFARLPAERRPVALVGDGVTDLEAATAVERFVGFGGVERRERVVAGTPFFVAVPTLLPTLDYLLTDAESAKVAADPRLRRLLL